MPDGDILDSHLVHHGLHQSVLVGPTELAATEFALLRAGLPSSHMAVGTGDTDFPGAVASESPEARSGECHFLCSLLDDIWGFRNP